MDVSHKKEGRWRKVLKKERFLHVVSAGFISRKYPIVGDAKVSRPPPQRPRSVHRSCVNMTTLAKVPGPLGPREIDTNGMSDAAQMRAGIIPYAQTKSLDDYLRDAAETGDAAEIRRLLDEGADVNCVDCLNKTPMHLAAIYGRAEALRVLKEKGGNPDARAMGNKRPLDWVNKPGSKNKEENEVARALLESWAAGAA